MQLIDITAGVKLYKDDKVSVLFGVPPEVIKFLMIKKIDFPEYIVLPDKIYHNGILQNCTEFPLYYFLFVLGNYFKGKKLHILGTKESVKNNRELLRLTLLGPTKDEFNSIAKSSYYDTLYKEARYLSLKDKNGEEVPIDGLVSFKHFQDNIIKGDGFTLIHKDRNVYELNGNIIDINFDDEQIPPYELKIDYVPMMPSKFGVDILGGGSGFTPNRPCSSVLLNYNSDYMLLDCVPYLNYHLKARGISKQQIKSLFLTHIHDDHCNIFPLVFFNNKIKFLGTKEVYWMALKKLSLMTMHKFEEFYSYFDFIELEPYQENSFFGMTIIPHYTVHSIPTIGATFKMNEGSQTFSIAYIGDNKSLPEIKKMFKKNIVSKEQYEYLLKLYRDRYNLLFADSGMGILHGDPKDCLESKSDRVIFLHLDKLPEEFDATFSKAVSGKRYIIKEGKREDYIIKTMEIFYKTFTGISEEWMTALMSNLTIIMYNSGDIIMKQGEERKGYIYIILSGSCSVLYHDGKRLLEIATKEAGDFIGEMAIIRRVEKRSASVVAKTPVTLCQIDEELFYSFLMSEDRIESIMKMWQIRRELENNYPFSQFADIVNEKISKASKRKEIKKGEIVIQQNTQQDEFFIILNGSFIVKRDGKKIDVLSAGNFFGEFGSLEDRARNATVVAEKDSVILEISKENIRKLINSIPTLHFYINQIMKERSVLRRA